MQNSCKLIVATADFDIDGICVSDDAKRNKK